MATSHRVEQGESLYTIAKKYGFPNWRAIFDHPSNAELRKKRKNPQVLHPGDVVHIPDGPKGATLEIPLDRRTVITRMRSGFQPLRLILLDADGCPLDNLDYRLSFAGGEHQGKTDDRGHLRVEIPVGVTEVTLKAGQDTWTLLVGHLNPLSTDTDDEGASGCQARLKNLGYHIAEVGGPVAHDTRLAVEHFQREHDLKTTGRVDDATRARLLEEHGS